MPNHIQNRLKVIGDNKAVAEVLNHIASKDEDGKELQIDFNKILPMPESLNISAGSDGEMAHELLFGTKRQKYFPVSISENQKRFSEMDIERQRECVELAIKYENNLKLYGATTWYDWCVTYWGTKWNAYHQNDERNTEDTVYFQTAWACPTDLICMLSKQFPLVTLQLDYADEDTSSNTGRITMKGGEILISDQPEDGSMEAYELYFELHPDSVSDYKLVNGKYTYVEEED